MAADFSLMDRLSLALSVMRSWEVLATLGAFIALWLLVRYVSDPWRAEARRSVAKPRASPKKAEPVAPPAEDDISEDILPD